VEFLSLAQIRSTFGQGGIRDYGPDAAAVGQITDDTQMTLYTAAALLEWSSQDTAGAGGESAALGQALSSAYLHWLATQGQRGLIAPTPDRVADLAHWPGMSEQRAPGLTCLSALANLTSLEARVAHNDRKGCGGVMRVAPIGLAALGQAVPYDFAFDWGVRAAAITHGHPTGYLAAGATAVIVCALAQQRSLGEAVAEAERYLCASPDGEETLAALLAAKSLAQAGPPSAERLETLGGGWVAEETLAIAVYCALVAPDLESGIVLAANHSGDSDSTASVAGQFLGLMHGLAAIPLRWLRTLESRELLLQTADALANVAGRAADPRV
jgi:ADP-ribosylglycohydrolase